MRNDKKFSAEGGCACGEVRYRINRAPLFVHCCHCRDCQRETGTAFALNALIEAAHIELLRGAPAACDLATRSGKGQRIMRCPTCRIALWSYYLAIGEQIGFVRIGTLDDPAATPDFSPDLHLYTQSKQDWVAVPADKSVPRYYRREEWWSEASLERWRTVFFGG